MALTPCTLPRLAARSLASQPHRAIRNGVEEYFEAKRNKGRGVQKSEGASLRVGASAWHYTWLAHRHGYPGGAGETAGGEVARILGARSGPPEARPNEMPLGRAILRGAAGKATSAGGRRGSGGRGPTRAGGKTPARRRGGKEARARARGKTRSRPSSARRRVCCRRVARRGARASGSDQPRPRHTGKPAPAARETEPIVAASPARASIGRPQTCRGAPRGRRGRRDKSEIKIAARRAAELQRRRA